MSVALYGGQGPTIVAVGWTLAGVTALLMLMRVYVRYAITRYGGWALTWSGIAFLATTIELIFATVDVSYGLGNHLVVIEESGKASQFLFWLWMTNFWFTVNVPLGKIAAASFLIALHAQIHMFRIYLLHFVAISNIVLAIPVFFMGWLQCNPPKALWDPLNQQKCNSSPSLKYIIFLSAWSAASDLILVALPICLVWPLQMDRKLKLFISCLMGLGVFAAVSSIMVAYNTKLFSTPDVSYDLTTIMLWGKATTWLVLISTSVPPAWPLIKIWIAKVYGRCPGQMSYQGTGNDGHIIALHSPFGYSRSRAQRIPSSSEMAAGDSTRRSKWRQGKVDALTGYGFTARTEAPESGFDDIERLYLGRKVSTKNEA